MRLRTVAFLQLHPETKGGPTCRIFAHAHTAIHRLSVINHVSRTSRFIFFDHRKLLVLSFNKTDSRKRVRSTPRPDADRKTLLPPSQGHVEIQLQLS